VACRLLDVSIHASIRKLQLREPHEACGLQCEMSRIFTRIWRHKRQEKLRLASVKILGHYPGSFSANTLLVSSEGLVRRNFHFQLVS